MHTPSHDNDGIRPEARAPAPRADIGVLLVHGIGDHKEGQTLTAFGEPLLDWLREWLRGKSANPDVFALTDARLAAIRTEAESPAYVLATIHPRKEEADYSPETWLLCEAWWGGSVQPPVALTLLKWLWSRGPLLIFWHFYLKSDLKTDPTAVAIGDPTRGDSVRAVVAFLLAASCQIVVAVATVLWLIPIGKWRQAVANAVRALTLTLGDSYVLLEHDIQKAGLVERVERSLAWLTARCQKIAVVAHSQGGAIAHEAIVRSDKSKVQAFVSLGSGLEKLQFLQRVRQTRGGLTASACLVPLVTAGVALLVYGLSNAGQRWQIAVGAAVFFLGLMCAGVLLAALEAYRKSLEGEVQRLKLSRAAGDIAWTDISASHDVVPMGRGSLLTSEAFVSRVATTHEQSYLRDHVSYFQNRSSSLPHIWKALGAISRLTLVEKRESESLERFGRLHLWYARVLTWSRWTTYAAIVVALVAFRHELVEFGASVIRRVDGSPANDLLKPVRAVASVLAWLVQLVWAPQVSVSDQAAQAIVGALVLAGGLTVWTVAFKGVWRIGTMARWRRACRGLDVLHDRRSEVRSFGLCASFQALGAVPLLCVLILIVAPQLLSLAAIGQALGAAVAIMCGIVALFFTLVAPWYWRSAREPGDDDESPEARDLLSVLDVAFSFQTALVAGLLAWAGAASWPYATGASTGVILATLCVLHGIAWQAYAVYSLRGRVRLAWLLAAMAVPVLATAGWWAARGAQGNARSSAFVFGGAALAAAASVCFAGSPEIAKNGLAALRRLVGRSFVARFAFWD